MKHIIEEEKKESILNAMKKYNLSSIDKIEKQLLSLGLDVEKEIKSIQPIAFDNAISAYTLGLGIALEKKAQNAKDIALCIGEGLQAFCSKGSVAENRNIGIGHGELASRLLDEKTNCFCFLAGHESFAASEGAIGMVENANKVRKNPLKIILLGLGKDASYIISRINGFTFVQTKYNHEKDELEVVQTKSFSQSTRANIKVYGAFDVDEGVAIMKHEKVDVSITGNSTNPVRFTHLVAGIYKKYCNEHNHNYFSIASGGGTGRTLHPDNVGAGPASYGLTDTMGRMHSSAQFAGSSSVPAHVNMMGFIGMGNNPIVGATVALSVKLSLLLKNK